MTILKHVAKSLFQTVAPRRYAEWRTQRSRAHSERLEDQWGCSTLTRTIIDRHGPQILRGPFQGVVFVSETYHRHVAPKLLGTYEEELHPVWATVFRARYDTVVNVGAADGVYAVGLARQFPEARVVAVDPDPWARRTIRAMARRNGMSNLSVLRACLPNRLSALAGRRTFILSDCEGFEDALFMSCSPSALRGSDLLIELHEDAVPGVAARLSDRLSPTHRLRFIESTPSDPRSVPETRSLSEEDARMAVSDLRSHPQWWLFAVSRAVRRP